MIETVERASRDFLYRHALDYSRSTTYADWYADRYAGDPLDDCPAHTGAFRYFLTIAARCSSCDQYEINADGVGDQRFLCSDCL